MPGEAKSGVCTHAAADWVVPEGGGGVQLLVQVGAVQLRQMKAV